MRISLHIDKGWLTVPFSIGVLTAAGCTTTVPTPSLVANQESPLTAPSHSAEPTATILPSASPTPELTIRIGGLARVASAMTGSSASEYLPTDTPSLIPGSTVFVVDGPQSNAGVDSWLLATETARGPAWYPATNAAGAATLRPFEPKCPDPKQTLTLDDLRPIGRLGSIACFGSTDIRLTGHVDCYSGTEDGGLGGTSWSFEGVHCYMGGEYPILGKAMTSAFTQPGAAYPLAGTYVVTGHFDDPESAKCGFYRFATSVLEYVGDPTPVLECRKQFVSTSVTKTDE